MPSSPKCVRRVPAAVMNASGPTSAKTARKCRSSSISGRFDATGEPTGYLGIAYDVSERHATQERLKRGASELRAVQDAASDAIVLIGPDTRFLSVNRQFEAMFG